VIGISGYLIINAVPLFYGLRTSIMIENLGTNSPKSIVICFIEWFLNTSYISLSGVLTGYIACLVLISVYLLFALPETNGK
jgi:hypothetical protein